MLITEMTVRTQGDDVEWIIVGRILVDVMQLRPILSADSTSVIELLKNRFSNSFRYYLSQLSHTLSCAA